MNRKKHKELQPAYYLDIPTLVEFTAFILIFAAEFWIFYSKPGTIDPEISGKIEAALLITFCFIPLMTPIAERMRNAVNLVLWGTSCVIWLLHKDDLLTALLPLATLVYIQVCRFIFRLICKNNPIPLLFNQYAVHRYSKVEKRMSNQNDFYYTVITFVTWAIVLITSSVTILTP